MKTTQRSEGLRALFGHALRRTFRAGYRLDDLRADTLAGLVTGVVALPLSMALAIATGVPPEHGLYTAIVAGVIVALLGGAPLQVSGPTAAFVVLLAPISAKYGLGGLCLASLMAGVLMTAMALMRLGTLVRYVPQPVVLGFTGGIGVVIATLQLKDFLGLPIAKMPESYLGKVMAIGQALPQARLADAAVGATTLALLLIVPKVTKRVPPALVALSVATLGAFGLSSYDPSFSPANIMGRFSYVVDGVRQAGIPRLPPLPALSWFTHGPDGQPLAINFGLIVALLPNAATIALLAAIESLLAAVVADSMSGRRHNADAELLGLSVANVVAPFFGGFAATGAIARTAINIRSGARSPVSTLIHAAFVLAGMLVLAPVLGYVPMASMAALLLTVAWNMSDARGIVRALREAPRPDVMVLVASLSLTVIFDMVVSVASGVLLSTVLFARHMARSVAIEHEKLGNSDPRGESMTLPAGLFVHSIDGPLFFGDSEYAVAQLRDLHADARAVVLDLSRVSMVDASGLASLDEAVRHLDQQGISVVVVPPERSEVARLVEEARMSHRIHASPSRLAALAHAQSQLSA